MRAPDSLDNPFSANIAREEDERLRAARYVPPMQYLVTLTNPYDQRRVRTYPMTEPPHFHHYSIDGTEWEVTAVQRIEPETMSPAKRTLVTCLNCGTRAEIAVYQGEATRQYFTASELWKLHHPCRPMHFRTVDLSDNDA